MEMAKLLSLASEFGFQPDIAAKCLQELSDLYGHFQPSPLCNTNYIALRFSSYASAIINHKTSSFAMVQFVLETCVLFCLSLDDGVRSFYMSGSDGQDFLTVEHCGDDYLAKLADATQADEDWDTEPPYVGGDWNMEGCKKLKESLNVGEDDSDDDKDEE